MDKLTYGTITAVLLALVCILPTFLLMFEFFYSLKWYVLIINFIISYVIIKVLLDFMDMSKKVHGQVQALTAMADKLFKKP